MILKHIISDFLAENTYVIHEKDNAAALIIDPGASLSQLEEYLTPNNLKPTHIFCTHAHVDHVRSAALLQKNYGAKLYIHKSDAPILEQTNEFSKLYSLPSIDVPKIDHTFSDEEEIIFLSSNIKIFHTPGHSPGCVCIYTNEMLFSGDTIFKESIGRTDLPGSDESAIFDSIENKIMKLPDEVKIYTGHGESTTVGHERKNNPFLGGRSWI